MDITIAEELLLLAHDEETGRPHIREAALDLAVTGAILAELTLAGRLRLAGDRLEAGDRTPTGDEELDGALGTIAESQPREARWWLDRLTYPKRRWSLLKRLAERGVLSEQHGKVLGLFRTSQYPERDPRVEREIRRRLHEVLDGAEPDGRVSVLVALVGACGLGPTLFPGARRDRVREIAEGQWTGPAVADAIAAINNAVRITTHVAMGNIIAASD
ncbi:GPP34 family phosphoprotein [Nonomuraea sp. NPDC050404]|uniref:GOLPH3/VPS74 family protein n=1 Tax=Nonomuraea sp. NPDC050404 TaxID=3155783 RepID=UPI0033E99948